MPRESSTRACLTLKSGQLEALREISRRTGAPVAELARRAVDAYLGRMSGYSPGTPPLEAVTYESGTAPSTIPT
jgi:Ribbon-helix-helix domain